MGNCISGCLHQFKDLQFSSASCMLGASTKKSDFATAAPASEVDQATWLTSHSSSVEEQIEKSKCHWSTLANSSGDMGEVELDFEVSNEQEFKALQRHPTWGSFFANFSGDGKSTSLDYIWGELVLGKKFAEGGQAELFDVKIKWNNPENVEVDLRKGVTHVLKVFKEGTLLKHVKSQMPQGLLQFHFEAMENVKSPTPKVLPQLASNVYRGILLKDGRFALLMKKEHFDLRILIESNMKLRSSEDQGPFSKEEVESIMYKVALGVNWLHERGIVHRDLKASNILVQKFGPKWRCYVADYECSIGVVGTNYFVAPEILQVCKEHKVNERPEVFSREADVYSYGMICYEILTGKLPFEDHPWRYRPSLLKDLVMNQHLRPDVPKYVEDWTRELLCGCWQTDPSARPKIKEILNIFLDNSREARRLEVVFKERFGEILGS